MKPPKGVSLVSAKYLKDYLFLFKFSDKKESVVNFEPIISYGTSLLSYLDTAKFKKINIDYDRGDIYWGKDWDMCFHIEDYYMETEIHASKKKAGRKPLLDKKVLLRLYIHESLVKKHGGAEIAQEKCTKYLAAI